MWNLNANDLHQLRGAGGQRFMEFVDRLIRAEAARGGLPQSEIQTQLRANIADGGVDTQVKLAIPQDQSGWFAAPTCWQYKAVNAVDIDDKPKQTNSTTFKRRFTSHTRRRSSRVVTVIGFVFSAT